MTRLTGFALVIVVLGLGNSANALPTDSTQATQPQAESPTQSPAAPSPAPATAVPSPAGTPDAAWQTQPTAQHPPVPTTNPKATAGTPAAPAGALSPDAGASSAPAATPVVPGEPGNVPVQATSETPPSASDLTVAARIRGYIDNAESAPALAQPVDGTVRRFYERRHDAPAWWGDAGWSPQAHAALTAMRNADADGLDPTAYRPDLLETALRDTRPGPLATAAALDQIAVTDVALSAAFLRYIRDMSGGGLDPRRFGWDIPWEYVDPAQMLTNGLASPDMKAWLTQLAPRNQAYAGLRTLLPRYRLLAEKPWSPLPPGPTLRPGDRDPRVAVLRRTLITLGDLPPEGPQSHASHKARIRVASSNETLDLAPPEESIPTGPIYDDRLVRAVRRFQGRHGIAPDGVIGEATRAALNISPRQRLAQIRANMQRLRWMPRDLPARFISVNLPGYQLQAIENNQVRLTMRVVAGQPDWPTPILYDWIVGLKFAPTWTIPAKIARTETLAKIKADPSYLNRMGFDVLAGGAKVNPAGIQWWRLNERNFPYTLRQRPGKENALGQIRFSLTNPYNIYLHDTSNPTAFRKWGRNLSHGCVRVEQPEELATFVMNDPAWPATRLRAMMNLSKTTTRAVPNPVPVLFVYFTAWRDANGEAQFRADMYQLDPALIAALHA